jgi:hypothetical protein
MARLVFRDNNGRTREELVSSRADVLPLGIGKKWNVSLDGGKTFRSYQSVTDADWRAFLPPLESDPPKAASASPPPRELQTPSPSPPRTEDSPAVKILEARVLALGALETRVDELGAHVAKLGAIEHPRRGEFDELRATFRTGVEDLRAAVPALAEEALTPRLERVAASMVARIEAKLERLKIEQDTLDDLAAEQVESVARYRPGTVETLRQQLAAERSEIERLREKLRAGDEALDAREVEINRFKATEGAVDPGVVDRLRGDVARLRGELETRKDVEAERDDLRRQLAELEVIRERYKNAQAAQEADIEARRELERVTGERAKLEIEFDALNARAEQFETARDSYRDALDRRGEMLEKCRATNRALQEEVATHKQSIDALTAERDALTATTQGALERAAAAEARGKTHAQQISDDARREREARDAAYERRREAVRSELEREWERERGELQRQAEAAQHELARAKERSAQLEEEAQRTSREADEARAEQRAWRTQEAERAAALRAHEGKLASIVRDLEKINGELDAAREKAEAHERDVAEQRARRREELEELGVRLATRRTELDELEAKTRRGREDARAEREARIEILHRPVLRDEGRGALDVTSEREWLDRVSSRIKGAGFHFSPRLIESFHTSLKIAAWSPLTVLAGVSGTGKSELPRLYSHYGGLRFLPVPVQPNWDSPQDLFGFFDYVAGRFSATELVRAMYQSQREPAEGGFNNGLLVVLLDEMNLARVELYFSELLSRLETRRGLDVEIARERCAVRINLGAGLEEHLLPLGENVLWAGTMNEDESTQTLSDKVLDRGNVLTFPRPTTLHSREKTDLGAHSDWLPRGVWESWQRRPEDTLSAEARGEIRDALRDVNQALSRVQRAVGHRVMQAIERYVANHPAVSAVRMEARSADAWRAPFEDQIVQKVMPKLRGVNVDGRAGRACLDGVRSVLDRVAPGLVSDFQGARDDAQGAFVWTRASYLDENAT